MKATVTNVESVLRSINVSTTEYFNSIDECDNNSVFIRLNSSYRYADCLEEIETALEEQFYMMCFVNGDIMLTSK